MEKYARQAVLEGVQDAEELHVSTESELYRVLMLHYNRNNQIDLPDHFRAVVEATLKEFFHSIQVSLVIRARTCTLTNIVLGNCQKNLYTVLYICTVQFTCTGTCKACHVCTCTMYIYV